MLLLVPLAVIWRDIRPASRAGWLFGAILVAIWLSPVLVWRYTGIAGRAARPLENLTFVSYQFSRAARSVRALGNRTVEAK